jgi:hypothetical protein
VLLPSDTHRKPITSITAVLLPFMSHLLMSLVYRIQKNTLNEIVIDFFTPVRHHRLHRCT